ncbi:MAG: VOC family protein [Betaproteobacteria bacterium]|nr:VOC family protein [Betaproteobacteria bacterium]
MNRFHVHVSVSDLDANIRFYSSVFGMPPTVRKDDYAKWMVEDPRINFAISARGGKEGINHMGIQVDTPEELAALRSRAASAALALQDEKNARCCYALSDKYWLTDPQGIAWETYQTLDEIPVFGAAEETGQTQAACCAPRATAPATDAAPAKCCG